MGWNTLEDHSRITRGSSPCSYMGGRNAGKKNIKKKKKTRNWSDHEKGDISIFTENQFHFQDMARTTPWTQQSEKKRKKQRERNNKNKKNNHASNPFAETTRISGLGFSGSNLGDPPEANSTRLGPPACVQWAMSSLATPGPKIKQGSVRGLWSSEQTVWVDPCEAS